MTAELGPLTPDDRKKTAQVRGVPVRLSDGQTWTLKRCLIDPAIDEVRNRIYAYMTIKGKVRMEDIRTVGFLSLVGHYRLTGPEAAGLIHVGEADEDALIEAVTNCLFWGAEEEFTYSQWVRCALLAAGRDPANIPDDDVPGVMRHLVGTGQALPLEKFTTADQMAAVRSNLLGWATPKPAAAPPGQE